MVKHDVEQRRPRGGAAQGRKRRTLSTLATQATPALTLTSGTWYEGKVVVDNDPNDANLQQLRFWVDTDGDGDYSDETTLLTSTAVDDVWSAGYVGLYRAGGGSAIQQYDDVKIDNPGTPY